MVYFVEAPHRALPKVRALLRKQGPLLLGTTVRCIIGIGSLMGNAKTRKCVFYYSQCQIAVVQGDATDPVSIKRAILDASCDAVVNTHHHGKIPG